MIVKQISTQLAKTISYQFTPIITKHPPIFNFTFKPVHTFSTIKNPYRTF